MRPHPPAAAHAERLVIISPHGESTRFEFGRAFGVWAQRELDTTVDIDWRTPGGTRDIQRLLEDRYKTFFSEAHPEFTGDVLSAFADPKIDAADSTASADKKAARAAFLASDTATDMDLWWGGGEFPHREFAQKGITVDAGLLQQEPGWFTDEVIPRTLSGETIYDPKGRYYGTCLSTFGICSSPDRLALLSPSDIPRAWSDLGDARFFGQVTMVDPTRSAAIVSALERLIQQHMAAAVGDGKGDPETLSRGWSDAFVLIKRIAGNARALSDGASKAVRDVVRGDATVAMCIDFHARAEAAYSIAQTAGTSRISFVAPIGGTSISADPISLLRGAPHRKLAVAFIRFALSPEGQRLWSYRIGEPGGPQKYELYRMPVRKDVYTGTDRAHMSDAGMDPFTVAASFTYHAGWTAPLYGLIGPLTKAVILDPREELIAAWRAILDAGGPEAVPEAWREFCWMPITYGEAKSTLAEISKDSAAMLPITRRWTVEATAHYRAARRLAATMSGAR